jgi:regulator of sigma E protease
MISVITTVLIFVVIIGLAITVHELGHFIAAKLSGIRVDEFSLGFGPKIWSKKIGDTEYMVKFFPVGGYVSLLGEEEVVKSKDSFSEKGIWEKIFVAVGGIIMNFILAAVVFYGVLINSRFEYMGFPYYEDMNLPFGSQTKEYAYYPLVLEVVDGEGADKAGLKPYYQIKSVNGNEIINTDELKSSLSQYKKEEVEIGYIDEEGNESSVFVSVNNDGKIGIYHAEDVAILKVSYNGWEKYLSGFLHSVNMVKANIYIIGQTINQSIEEHNVQPIAESVSGPVGLLAITDTIKNFGGFVGLVELLGVLNIALMITNLAPFPGLDGSHIVIILVEEVRGKPIDDKIKKIIFGIGIVILFVLAGLVAIKDVVQFGVWDWVRNLF